MPLPFASAIPILAIVLALVLGPILDVEIRRAKARRDGALAQLIRRQRTKDRAL